MPLPLPDLDDRRWQELVTEAQALIPRFAPAWTDHNVHDPGIMLIELWAWLTEMTAYRINRVPARHVAKFLGLTGFQPGQPRPARALIEFLAGPFPSNPDGIPAGALLTTDDGMPFRTVYGIQLADVVLDVVQVEEVDAGGARHFHDRTRCWREGTPFAAFGAEPRPGAAVYLGFSVLPTQERLSIGCVIDGAADTRRTRRRLLDEVERQHAFCHPPVPEFDCSGEGEEDDLIAPISAAPEHLAQPPHHSARLAWEFSTGDVARPFEALSAVVGLPNEGEVDDRTRSLTLTEGVELNVPATVAAASIGAVPDPLFYLRCRLTEGNFDAPPRLARIAPNAVVVEQSAAAFQRFAIVSGTIATGPDPAPGESTGLRLELDDQDRITQLAFVVDGSEPLIRVLSYEPATAASDGELVLALAVVGHGTGLPDQVVEELATAVEDRSVQVFTLEGGHLTRWTARPDFDASARIDRHFVLDSVDGSIVFGNGESGRLPARGVAILASWRHTEGPAGNIAAGNELAFAESPLNQPWLADFSAADRVALLGLRATSNVAAVGGRGREDLASVLGRVFETQHAHRRLLDLCEEHACSSLDEVPQDETRAIRPPTRAVNLLDFERLALSVPATRVARARAWPAFHPGFGCLRAKGVVTVVVVPDRGDPRPRPSAGLLRAVRNHLDARRMITTRVEVVGPEYVEVQVEAEVVLCPHTDAERVRLEIGARIDAFFDPRSGGPRGLGWPFGRDVFRSEILQLIDEIAGVDFVSELRLRADSSEATCGNIPLCPTQLVSSGEHTLRVREDLDG